MSGLIGRAVHRREDPALITGEGRYTDDLQAPGMVHAAMVRSPYAHARVAGIDIARARAMPGVLAVFTGNDLLAGAAGGVVPTGWLLPEIKTPPHPLLATERVRYVGDGVAVVVAADRYRARDAAEAVEVSYAPLDAVVDPRQACQPGAPQLHEEAPGNIAFDWQLGDAGKTAAAFAAAVHTVRLDLRNNRLIPHAIEPRAALASFDPASGVLTLTMTTQNPHLHRLLMTLASMGMPEHKIRVIAPEVGGGFGSKIHHYPDEAVTSWCSIRLGRPVKWVASRSEANQTDAHGRDHVSIAEIALDAGAKITGLRVETWAAMGAYLSTFAAAVPTYLYGTLLSGQYDIPAIHVHTYGTFTNTAPVDAYRGAGRPEATFVVERLLDAAARTTGLDPAEIRRRNFIRPDQFPYATQVALEYDSGNYQPALDKALEMAGYQQLRAEQQTRRADASKPLLGIGLSSYIEACGLAPSQVVGALGAQAGLWESARVRVHPSGSVSVFTGVSAHGQGHHTSFAQIVADKLAVDMDQVQIIHGDTDKVQFGMGTYGSRSLSVGGSALVKSLDKVITKARIIAAHLLEAAEEDVVFEHGSFHVAGAPARSKAWADVVLMAYLAHDLPAGLEPGLEETTFYDPENFVFPFGTHVAVVEIDRDTGEVRLVRYVAVDDCGNLINPMIVDGQVHGGVAQGVGQALWEEGVYDPDGQLLTATMLDYALPRAHRLPSFDTAHTITPCPHNPLGVKGIGEAGAIASPAAVTNAVVDALGHLGLTHLDMPLTPERVWRAMNRATGDA